MSRTRIGAHMRRILETAEMCGEYTPRDWRERRTAEKLLAHGLVTVERGPLPAGSPGHRGAREKHIVKIYAIM